MRKMLGTLRLKKLRGIGAKRGAHSRCLINGRDLLCKRTDHFLAQARLRPTFIVQLHECILFFCFAHNTFAVKRNRAARIELFSLKYLLLFHTYV